MTMDSTCGVSLVLCFALIKYLNGLNLRQYYSTMFTVSRWPSMVTVEILPGIGGFDCWGGLSVCLGCLVYHHIFSLKTQLAALY